MSGALCAGFKAGPFGAGQVDRFLQEMESRVVQMRQAAEEEKVGSTSTVGCYTTKVLVPVHKCYYHVGEGHAVVYSCTCSHSLWKWSYVNVLCSYYSTLGGIFSHAVTNLPSEACMLACGHSVTLQCVMYTVCMLVDEVIGTGCDVTVYVLCSTVHVSNPPVVHCMCI